MKKVLPPTYFLGAIVIMAGLHFLLPAAKVIPFPWNLLGAVPLILGIVINLIADASFKRHGTTVKPFEASSVLVTTGVFRISRNPMYIGLIFLLLGLAILMGSVTPFIVIPIFGLLMDIIFIREEEKMLEEQFGGTWRKYSATVRRWI